MRFLAILAALPLAACGSVAIGSDKGDRVEPSGAGGSRTYQVTDFTGVELAGADDVDVKVGSAFSVRAEGPAEELDKLEIRRDGDTLRVGRKRDGGWLKSSKPVKIHVTMPAIREASLAGSGDMTVDTVQGGDFEGDLAGSGNLRVGRLQAGKVSFDLAGSGNIVAGAGQAERLEVDIAGSGNVEARGVKARGADISIAGSGNVAAEVDGDAKVTIMGSGDVTLGGKARCTTSKMGSGSVRCG
ncbi:head GIN domain-containing protein [Sphingomonas sp.]|uniref:head GIN domain-containing protein n=1 Tax=Sphingomonas sp. TaxID=28214 RepID=UPI002DD6B912|nr:head GIN domain-containing protein [Sphingomonas sp.]